MMYRSKITHGGSRKITTEDEKRYDGILNFPGAIEKSIKTEVSKRNIAEKKFSYYTGALLELQHTYRHEKKEDIKAKIKRNSKLVERQINSFEDLLDESENKIVKMELENKMLEKLKNTVPYYAKKTGDMINGIKQSILKTQNILDLLEEEIRYTENLLKQYKWLEKKANKTK